MPLLNNVDVPAWLRRPDEVTNHGGIGALIVIEMRRSGFLKRKFV